jgi:hypothetical protein
MPYGIPIIQSVLYKSPYSGCAEFSGWAKPRVTPPAPTPPAAIQMVWGEIPAGAIDGTNRNYVSAKAYTAGLLAVYLNGLRQRRTDDYAETGTQAFQLINAPLPGDSLSIDYVQS